MTAPCAARRWLARNAAGVKLIRNWTKAAAPACARLVSCLPALEDAELRLPAPLSLGNLECLLDALAGCPRLRALSLSTVNGRGVYEPPPPLFESGCARALAALRSLTRLALSFADVDNYTLADVVDAVVPLTGLAELTISLPKPAVVPAALGQLKGLKSLGLHRLDPCSFEAGCLSLPVLMSLQFHYYEIADAEMLPGISGLQNLTRVEFGYGVGPSSFNPQLAQLPKLQHLVFNTSDSAFSAPRLGLPRLPADMGTLRLGLLHLDISGHRLTRFPLVLTQLMALECLKADENGFAELPAGITALSRLTELTLGRDGYFSSDPLQQQQKRPLDVRALGDLSAFPALCKLTFTYSEVTMCTTVLGAAWHKSLTSLDFVTSHPARECALTMLQLRHALKQVSRGSVLRFGTPFRLAADGFADSWALPPSVLFNVALRACGLLEGLEGGWT